MAISVKFGLLAGLIMMLGLGACAIGEPFEQPTAVDEIPPGAGLFSGKAGEFVIYRR